MRQRSPLLYYVAGILTLGVFWALWPFIMASDINESSKGSVPGTRVLGLIYAVAFVTFWFLSFDEMHRISTAAVTAGPLYQSSSEFQTYAWAMYACVGILFAIPIYLVVRVASFLRAAGGSSLSGPTAALLFLLWCIGLPVLQRRLNALYGQRNLTRR